MSLPYRAALLSGLLIGVSSFLTACGPQSSGSPVRVPAESARMLEAIVAFDKSPSVATWKTLHDAMLEGPLTGRDERLIVDALTNQAIPEKILNAVVVDLASVDWIGTMRCVHRRNLSARSDRSPRQSNAVRNSARLAWLMLAVRASYADDFVDLSQSDLRSGLALVGQSANLANVDFSASTLSGATWRESRLAKARFQRTAVAGVLRCIGCLFGNRRRPGIATLVDGAWILR